MDKINKLLDLYTDYLISQNKYATATGLSDMLDNQISHDKITRFLNTNQFDSKTLWNYMKSTIREHEQDQGGVLIIDDTIEEKPYTDENEIISWHFDHTKNRSVKGINLLTALIHYDNGITLPIGYDTVTKDVSYQDKKTQKPKRRSSITKNVRMKHLLKQAVLNQVKFDYVLADSWFCSKQTMGFIEYELKKKFILGLHANRLVALCKQDKAAGKYQNVESLSLQDGEKRVVYLNELSFQVAIMAKHFKNGDGSRGILYLASNDLASDVNQIYSVYQKRWRIEEYHKSIKQNTSLEKSPTKVVVSQKNHIFSSIIAYCKLELMKLKHCLNHFALKYKLLIKANQIAFQELLKIKQPLTFA